MRLTFWISLYVATGGLSASSQTVPTINACVNNLNGTTRVVASSANCIGGVETFKQWSVTGPQGPQGANGLQGAPGTQGPQGVTGFAGAQGPAGPTGNTGAPGAKGDSGAQGQQGTPGTTGAQGPAGPTGNTGAQGPAGPMGSTGAQGEVGPRGMQGAIGIGIQGPAGPAGSIGAQGPAGPTGPAGIAGPSGPTGATGATGGQIWSSVTTLPSSLIGPTYFFSPSGQSTPLASASFDIEDVQGTALQIPVSCVASHFKVTFIGTTAPALFSPVFLGPDMSIYDLYMPHVPTSVQVSTPPYFKLIGLSCTPSVVQNSNGLYLAACSNDTDTEQLTAGDFVVAGAVGLQNVPADAGARILTSFTCQ